MIYMWLWALDTIHHTAFNETAKYTVLHTSKYALHFTPDCTRLYTPSLLDLRSHLSSQDAPKNTPSTLPMTTLSTFRSALLSTFSCTLPGMLPRTLPLALDGTHLACLTVHFRVRSQKTLKHTPEHTVTWVYALSNWTLYAMILMST